MSTTSKTWNCEVCDEKVLSEAEEHCLVAQSSRTVSNFDAGKLEKEAQKHWDLFYKRNREKFFKNRYWTTREFEDLVNKSETPKCILEVGCGVGNFAYPLIEMGDNNIYVYACDFSPQAITLFKQHSFYDETKMKAFVCDITKQSIFDHVESNSIDIISAIFILSAIHPDNYNTVIKNFYRLLKPNGMVLVRDYGLYDMAQLRFKPGHKIGPNFYVRQDGTRAYYFSREALSQMFTQNGFKVQKSNYIHRKTVNVKENIDVLRIFVQGKFQKCLTESPP